MVMRPPSHDSFIDLFALLRLAAFPRKHWTRYAVAMSFSRRLQRQFSTSQPGTQSVADMTSAIKVRYEGLFASLALAS
ncbi:hypothetical protein C5748_26690 [Phyllobacterium phragmitis]|uniref:Uncharacterized protein n=1 Tax=Phyllobacterium phragmitis TaxID=2670329 RepID=A0A2S9IIY5_9HYPH|nr:hypothetical protein C5748_26690 [Phyllobacterium phragmitis]